MERNLPQLLKLGDVLNGIVIKSAGGRRFEIKCSGVPKGWKVELHARRPEQVRIGSNGSFWIAKIAPLQGEVLVHEGDYGRLPISEAMRPRYLAALKALLGETELTADLLADARAMIAQITKQQQADWLTVWKVLGEPAPGDQKMLIAAIDGLRTARKESPETLPALQAKLIARFGPLLRPAVRRLERD